VPGNVKDGLKVVKPVQGCGSEGVRLTEESPGPDEIGQQYIDGEHLSVSLVGSRVVGEACLYYSGDPPIVLAVNRQEIRIDGGRFEYLGGETPLHHPREEEIVAAAIKAATVMGCQGYAGVDIVLAGRPYVVDVNPRVTTSVVGIAACMKEEIADLLVKASRGEPIGPVHLSGRVTFTKDGRVTKA
jgi:predicted ATP-grasp superfamily ATP-dependent carboligase